MRRLAASLCVVVVLAVAAPSGQQTPPFTPQGVFPVLETYLESLRQQAGIPGMSAAVVVDGAIAWERGFGFQNVATRISATPDTPYAIGDMSGTLAAVLLLQCVEIRRLDLDVPLGQYGIAIPESTATLRQLLSHTYPEGPSEPFAYSAERYAQLTAVMEWCAPQPYRKSVAHRLLNRLAMKDSVPGIDPRGNAAVLAEGFFDAAELERHQAVIERMALPYKVDGRGRAERAEMPSMQISASRGVVSTVRDLARLDAALDDAILLRPETTTVAWQPATGRRGTPVPMGLGWFVQSHRGQRVVWHFGELPNAYSSLIVKVPDRDVTLILLANSDGLSAPFQLSTGDVTRSLFATLFLRLVT